MALKYLHSSKEKSAWATDTSIHASAMMAKTRSACARNDTLLKQEPRIARLYR